MNEGICEANTVIACAVGTAAVGNVGVLWMLPVPPSIVENMQAAIYDSVLVVETSALNGLEGHWHPNSSTSLVFYRPYK